ncbi:helix-turn-helix domain-containing protein [Cryobacterium sp. TMT2-17-1]|uniref:helix-turn-helix transcriptional regulator n=1 Tax=Cryobacterium sp. TMT2-17-1 TaxID=1259248 RepID=UPI00106CCBF7|nr:helix-turn-helix domain-containing protein [Cryobacterium sp. TMT2-17-1]TFC55426.1 helix-turn-helix domain-containing protein [Cryobacterium sp. TMT2-17-1]
MTTTAPAFARQRRFLDINELAEQLGISAATIYRKRSLSEDLPVGFKIGSRVRWRQETVDAWIEAQEAKAAI